MLHINCIFSNNYLFCWVQVGAIWILFLLLLPRVGKNTRILKIQGWKIISFPISEKTARQYASLLTNDTVVRALDFLQLLKLIWKPVFFDSDICKMGKRTLCTMVQNSLILGHQIIHFLTSLIVSEQANKWVMCKQNKQCEASKWMNGANKQANEQASCSVLRSHTLTDLTHSA